MHRIIKPLVAASVFTALVAGSVAVINSSAFAQAKQPAPPAVAVPAAPPAAAAPAQAPALKQSALTEQQIQGLLAAQKDLDAITEKLPDNPSGAPDPKVQVQLDEVAKKHGFASYDAYADTADNISLVLSGFDAKTKKFVGPDVIIKQQIAAIQADAKMSAKDKKDAVDELNEGLKVTPKIEFPANIELVGKYYDKLAETLQGDD